MFGGMSTDSDIIDAIGGTSETARLVGERLQLRVTSSNVSMWRKNGIPPRYRPAVKALAVERGVTLPPNFVPGEHPPLRVDAPHTKP